MRYKQNKAGAKHLKKDGTPDNVSPKINKGVCFSLKVRLLRFVAGAFFMALYLSSNHLHNSETENYCSKRNCI
jgi:hypothetical protein